MTSALAPPPLAALVQGIPPAAQEALMAVARCVALASGEQLFRLGDAADDLFVVKTGVVELTVEVPVGGTSRRVVVEEAAAGETIGWSALVPPHKYTLDAFAATESTVLAWRRDDLLAICRAQPDVGNRVLQNLLSTVGSRLHVLYAMWVRELKRCLEHEFPGRDGTP